MTLAIFRYKVDIVSVRTCGLYSKVCIKGVYSPSGPFEPPKYLFTTSIHNSAIKLIMCANIHKNGSLQPAKNKLRFKFKNWSIWIVCHTYCRYPWAQKTIIVFFYCQVFHSIPYEKSMIPTNDILIEKTRYRPFDPKTPCI